MTATTLFYIALLVFFLMIIGLYLSAREFVQVSNEPARDKDPKPVRNHDPLIASKQ